MIEEALQNMQSGNFAAAEVLFRKMLEDEPDNPEVLYMLALARRNQGDFDSPVELLTHALRAQPQNPTLHHTLGMVRLHRRELDEAEQAFFAAVGIDPNFAAAQNGIATVDLARGRYAAAEQSLRKALRAEPDNLQVQLNMGIAMLQQERAGDAISWLQRVVDQQPENHFALFHLGRAFMLSGNPGFAAGAYQKAAQLQPAVAETWAALGDAQSRNQQHADAAASYRRALDLGLENAHTLAGMARALGAQKRFRESEGAWLRALRLSAGEEQEKLLLEFAASLLQQQRFADVVQRLGPRLDTANDQPRLARMLAEAQLALGNAAAARELLRPLLAEGAPDDAARLMLARALHATGESEASRAQLERLLQSDNPPLEAILFDAESRAADGELANAIESLRGVQRRHDLSHVQRQSAVRLLATALHRQGDYRSAWEQYLGLDPQFADIMQLPDEQALVLGAEQPAETAMAREVAWSWPPQPLDDGRPEPVFLLAWPGSGRGRLLDALAGHSDIRVLRDSASEQSERRLLVSHPQGRDALNSMTPAQIQLARRKYWKLARHAHRRAGEFLTIDAMWLSVEGLPTIYRLFPQAKVIVLQADPRDLAVGWLQASYRNPEAMARRHAQQSRLLQLCQAGVPLKYIEVDGERLQEHSGNGLRDLVSALGLAWEAGVEDAFRNSKSPLPESGSWRHYENYLEPVFKALAQAGWG